MLPKVIVKSTCEGIKMKKNKYIIYIEIEHKIFNLIYYV